MSFETTTRKMADEAGEMAKSAEALVRDIMGHCHTEASAGTHGLALEFAVVRLAAAVEKLALCVSRRFPEHAAAGDEPRCACGEAASCSTPYACRGMGKR